MTQMSTEEALRALESRCMELEIRSEERLAEMTKLHEFVAAYELRINQLEGRLDRLKDRMENPPEAAPSPDQDLPPHY